MSITPEAMVKAILERRQAIASKLPDALHQRTEENNRAYTLAKDARETLKALKAKEDETEAHKEAVKKAQTCLLYTSPSPRDGLLSRMPSSA